MQTFTDSKGQQWRLRITVGAIKRVRELVGINLANLLEGEPALIHRLSEDMILMVDVLYALCEPEATEREITDHQFGGELGGPQFMAATQAFWRELNDFFRESPRPEWTRLIDKELEIAAQRTKTVLAALDGLTAVATPTDGVPGTPSGALPASSA